MSTRIPSLLEPYISLPPEASLILLTNVLGASSNWVVLRFLYSALTQQDGGSTETREQYKVVLLSFLRELGFWKEGARRLVSKLNVYSGSMQEYSPQCLL